MTDDPDSPSLTPGDPEVLVRIENEAWRRDLPDAEALCREAALAALASGLPRTAGGALGRRRLELGLLLTDDAAVRALNRDYRGQDRPTNVLSFETGDLQETPVDAGQPLLLGDVVLARQTVLREAAEQGKAAGDHLRHLVVHGTLHLLGFDHGTEAEAARMEALEVEVLAGLGIADPYGPAAPAGPMAEAAS